MQEVGALALEQATTKKGENLPDHAAVTLASDGTKDAAQTLLQPVLMPTSARSAAAMHTKVSGVKPHASDGLFDPWRNRPHYARGFFWADNEPARVTLAVHTLSAPRLPGPPANELLNSIANHTIAMYPHLFAVVSPVNVDHLEELLATHPNCPFTLSLCAGFRKGFWP